MAEPQLDRRKSCQKGLVALAAAALPPPVDFDALRLDNDQLAKIGNKKVKRFYEEQNEMIDRFMEVDRVIEALKHGVTPEEYGSLYDQEQHDEETPSERRSTKSTMDETAPLLSTTATATTFDGTNSKRTSLWIIHLAINLSFVANLALFATKCFLALFSGSMAILASAFESFLDIVSNAIIFFTIRIIRHKDYYTYPVGKSRMEPLGIIVFAVIITTSFTQVLMNSIERLTEPGKAGEELDLSMGALILLGANIAIKAVLWFWCAKIKGSSSVDALAHDHENDVVFSIASTIFPIVGIWAKMPWLDPVGAIILSIYIIYEWMNILLENIRRLTGQAASSEDIKQLTYMAFRFSAKITAVDTVRAYYNGDRLLVEIDIILPPECPLHEAHDVGEALQDALEMMENVERAFVHLDYNAHHEVEHRRVVDGVGFGG
ncbi:cation efflux family-domain-containing protein [Absidia repens]|uniref:Cation efflux family-domain-containing protein n=1 Tax=Absidia repens TaxID=90262 RepID=A0A1X2HKE2_9FUNG|nr:cation efflux family-domain-containing protein [Absidia repens]